ncbi:MAG: Wzy polymerase domain-containing protein [Rubrivivax sp.]
MISRPPLGPRASPAIIVMAVAAACGPSLLAYNVSPSPTFLNQALALALWGWFVALTALQCEVPRAVRHALRDTALPLAALALTALAAAATWAFASLPAGLALSALGLLAATALLLLSGAVARASAQAMPLFTAFCIGWVVAGALNAGIGIIQVFAPALADGDWLARSSLAGRAVGNLRQPNHLSSLLLWSAIAVVPLLELGRLRRRVAYALFALMVFAVVLTASRTGVLGIGLLALWGLLGRRLSRPTRGLLLSAPLLYALAWAGLALWAELSHHAFGGEARLAEADLSGSRFGIWANTLSLIRQQPWLGVGFGEFNFAWSLTPFPGRPTAFFDHTHNLPLHLAVELGLPLATLIMVLLLAGLWRAWQLAQKATAADAPMGVALRSAWMMLVLIGVHSQLEYPLWYAYFLLPAAWLWGFAMGRPRAVTSVAAVSPGAATRPTRVLFVLGMLTVVLTTLAVLDYARVVRIFSASPTTLPLAERIAEGQSSWLFAHHADYAAVTTDGLGGSRGHSFQRAPHYLLDTRLMIAWAEALAAGGEEDKARHLAQRLREFRNPLAKDFFAPCEAAPAPSPLPFQCQAPSGVLHWQDFEH